jgi:cell division protein FtsN
MASGRNNPAFALLLAGIAVGVFVVVIGLMVLLHEVSTHHGIAHF